MAELNLKMTSRHSVDVDQDFMILLVRLFAAMTKVDGLVLDIENIVAKSLIDSLDPEEKIRFRTLYDEELSDEGNSENLDELLEMLQEASNWEQRKHLVRMLSSIAISDGELHARETEFIQGLIARIGTNGA